MKKNLYKICKMMKGVFLLKKLLKIKNYSTFKDFKLNYTDWDGSFKKVNIVYAPNGSGKTSLSLLFESLKGNNELILKKRNLEANTNPEIVFLSDENTEIKFINEAWNKKINNLEVFNSFYLEDNVYKISLSKNIGNGALTNNIFNLAKLEELKEEVSALKKELSIASKAVSEAITLLAIKEKENAADIDKYINEFNNFKSKHSEINKRYKLSLAKANEVFQDELELYKNTINTYLVKFSSELVIKSVGLIIGDNLEVRHFVYDIEISGNVIRIDDRNKISLKYYLSDGDKNALALSFFLSQFNLMMNSNDYIVVVDDPFTSFDTHRRSMTIKELVKLSEKVKQLYIFTHDLHFASEYVNQSRTEVLNLQIKKVNGSNILKHIDFKSELLTGLMRDIITMHDFLDTGSVDNWHRIQIARAIRPSIEGLFRIKFFRVIGPNDWLGDFIVKIRNSQESSPFFRLRGHLDSIEEINDYSKGFHHSNSPYLEEQIDEQELRSFVQKALQLIQVI